jgi:pimeloyl-ACP methyl ester carboxylesterase
MPQKTSLRGEMIDIGGRRLRLVRAGPASDQPTILLESGSFGCAADWAEVQARLTALGLHSLAYDRAGLGLSDPGPKPRDGRAVCDDLDALLAAAGETGPFILAGHSMAGLSVRLFTARRPGDVKGVVLVDATTPESMAAPMVAKAVHAYRRATRLLGWGSRTGVMLPVSLVIGDMIGLNGEARAEKRRIYASQVHARWSAEEVQHWPATAQHCVEAGAFAPDLPVAVITAGAEHKARGLKVLQAAPAEASDHGYVEHVEGSNHASLLGKRYADAVVRGVEHVLQSI